MENNGFENHNWYTIKNCFTFGELTKLTCCLTLITTASIYIPIWWFLCDRGDEGIRILQNILSNNFNVVNFFALDHSEEELGLVPNISHYNKSDNFIEVGTDCDSSEEEENGETMSSEYDSYELEIYKKQKQHDINETLDKYKNLEYGMTFSNLKEAKQVIDFYAVPNKRDIRVKRSDKGRVTYCCVLNCPFRFSIYKYGRDQGFKIKTLNQEHTCYETYENRRAKAGILSQYFKKKVQNNPTFKIKDMKEHLESILDLDVNESKLKRVKRLVLDKLDGSYADDYNKLEAYAYELRMSNPGTDVVINLSRDAMEEGIQGRLERRFATFYRARWHLFKRKR
uniref:Transposase MuDR plant domain-containing protein n=1 Tax=Solanum lycopersicum TaxID=4081 RepID=A0A3Q7J995_SOLLC